MVGYNLRTALFLGLFLTGFLVIGQFSKISEGKVISKNKDITGVVVQNISNNKTTITAADGSFSIAVSLNDTLVFSAVQFKRKILPVTATVYNSSFFTVPLEEFVNQLDEVVVKPYNLSGNLNEDLLGLDLGKDVSAEALELPNASVKIKTQSERRLFEADNGKFVTFGNYKLDSTFNPMVMVNLNKILNRVTGRTKKLKKHVALDKAYKTTQMVEASFVDSLLVSHLKIPQENFYEFIQFCELDSSFNGLAQGNDELKLWEFLIEKSNHFREIKK